jgi:hypothetical protein
MRYRNDGLRKRCDCPRWSWPKCQHPWHFNFKWNGEHFRFSLEHRVNQLVNVEKDGRSVWTRDRATLGDRIIGKTETEEEAERLGTAIRDGSLLNDPPRGRSERR